MSLWHVVDLPDRECWEYPPFKHVGPLESRAILAKPDEWANTLYDSVPAAEWAVR